MSLLSRGAWIEIKLLSCFHAPSLSRSSHEERGLKSHDAMTFSNIMLESLLSRGAWIEISLL